MRNGRGICDYPNGDRYDGEWKDDLKDGRGKLFVIKHRNVLL